MKIGVFDSGFGGLTVLRALLETIPQSDYIYLGDTARLPYGSKSPRTVSHYACSSARFLYEQGAELIVIACNTASATALDDIRNAVPIPVVGVIEPGAAAAAALTRSKRVCVIGTQATVSSNAYHHALMRHAITEVEEKACPLFVPLVEEGWTDHSVTEEVARIYFDELFAACSMRRNGNSTQPDTLVLGCTHYPLLKPLFARVLPQHMQMVDSAEATAIAVKQQLEGGASRHKSAMSEDTPPHESESKDPFDSPRTRDFYVTDSLDKFQALGARFLGHRIESVELVTLPE